MKAPKPGLRSVLGDLVAHVAEFGTPDPATPAYADWLDAWGDRVLDASGFHREHQRAIEAERRAESAKGTG